MRFSCASLILGLTLSTTLLMSGCRSTPDPVPEAPKPRLKPPAVDVDPSSVERKERYLPVEGFEQLAGWTTDQNAELGKDEQHALWGKFAARLDWSPAKRGPYQVSLTPREPVKVDSVFNTITLWVLDPAPERQLNKRAIQLSVRDDIGDEHLLTLPYRGQENWQMLHLRLPSPLEWPVLVENITLVGEASVQKEDFSVWIDSLACYQERLQPIPQEHQFIRPFTYPPPYAPRRSDSVMLDFPRVPFAYRPHSALKRHVTSLTETAPGEVMFTYQGQDGKLEVAINSAGGGLPQVGFSWNGTQIRKNWSGLSLLNPGEKLVPRVSRVEGKTFQVHYSNGLRVQMELIGKTLQLDLSSVSDELQGLALGALPLGSGREKIEFPLMRLSRNENWPIALLRDVGDGLFVSVIPDWWMSMAGRFEGLSAGEQELDFGRLTYAPRWKGRRNPMRERVYVTWSPQVEEVMPLPCAPEGLYRAVAGERSWRGFLPDLMADSRNCQDLAAYGVRQVMQTAGPDSVHNRGFTPASADDDAGVRGMLQHRCDMGWRTGGYGEFSEVAPLHSEWSEDLLLRQPDGSWLPRPLGHFAAKSAHLMRLGGENLELLRERLGVSGLMYLDTLTAHPPWESTDYDARVDGAGTFTRVLEDRGTFLQQASAENDGPLLGPGGSEWLYAGFIDGLVSDVGGIGALLPLRPLFAWRNIHPFSALMGVGTTDQFRRPGELLSEAQLVDRMMALQLAYAATGRIPVCQDARLSARAQFMMLPIQHALLGQTLDRMMYWNGSAYITTGEAIRTGALNQSQLYLRSSGNIEIWINGSATDWNVKVAGNEILIPSFGFIVNDESLQGYSLADEESGFRWYAMKSPGLRYLDSLDQNRAEAGMAGRGAVALRPGSEQVELHVLHWFGNWWIAQAGLGLTPGTIEAFDRAGRQIAGATLTKENNGWKITCPGEPVRIVLR